MFDLLYRFIHFGAVILYVLQLSCGLLNFFVPSFLIMECVSVKILFWEILENLLFFFIYTRFNLNFDTTLK